jgi:hypothetical protein
LKQVPVHSAEEKRAFTLVVSVSSDRTVLPMQAIYTGKTECSCPSPNAPHYSDLINAGFLLEESGTTTYWSNHKTMHSFVNQILAPYFDNAKVELGLPQSQKSFKLWTIDVWSVHRSKEFMCWMRNNHPTIIVDFVPGGCNGVAQPCDVRIQQPLKLSIKKTYHEDIMSEVLQQIEAKSEVISIDSRVGTLQDCSM